MKKSSMKSALNEELKAAGFVNRVVSVDENLDFETVLRFCLMLTQPLMEWLQNRFVHGVTFTMNTDQQVCFINSPNKSNKKTVPLDKMTNPKTVGELVNALLSCDQSSPVEIAIRQYNKVYPVAYCAINMVKNQEDGTATRVYISLPDNMRTLTKKS